MKIFVLDTDIYSLFERGHSQIVARFLAIPAHELGITVITAEEKMRGRLAYSGLQKDATCGLPAVQYDER